MLDLTSLDSTELIALRRVFHEARFPDVCGDPAVALAPLVVDMHVALIEEDRRRLVEQGDAHGLDGLEKWRVWRGRPEKTLILSRIDADASFRRTVIDLGVHYVQSILRPFLVDHASAVELIDYAEEREARE